MSVRLRLTVGLPVIRGSKSSSIQPSGRSSPTTTIRASRVLIAIPTMRLLTISHGVHTIRTNRYHTGHQCTYQLVYQFFYQHVHEPSCQCCRCICSANYQRTYVVSGSAVTILSTAAIKEQPASLPTNQRGSPSSCFQPALCWWLSPI